jgi:flagellar basal-body rod protein FlgF
MRNSMQQLDAISRNVANLNTQGYKREVYVNRGFQNYFNASTIVSNVASPVAESPTQPSAQTPVSSHDFSAGALKFTGSPLNMAIQGKGYFQLQSAQGVLLTRDGQFQINQRGQLVSADGMPVLTKGAVSLDSTDFEISSDGTLVVGDQQMQLDLIDADPASLQLVGPGRYQSNITTPLAAGEFQLRQGYLEGSNVDSLTEMVDMMGVVRRVESSQQLMRAYDEIIDNAVSTLGQF